MATFKIAALDIDASNAKNKRNAKLTNMKYFIEKKE